MPTEGDVTAIGATELLVVGQGLVTPGDHRTSGLRENRPMTQTPDPAGTRGAVDLSAVTAMTTPGAATAGGGAPGRRYRPRRRADGARERPPSRRGSSSR